MKKFILLLILSVSVYSNINGQEDVVKNDKTEFNILFVGNSLTYTNDLPQLVKKYAKRKGIKIKTKMIAYPNYAIIDHWNDGKIQKLIVSKTYDYVIIQQGPSSQSEGRKMLIEDGQKISNLCALYDTKLCYFTVWPSLNYFYTFDGVIKNHRDAADINSAILLPVGEVWKNYIDTTDDKQYYGPDGFHPSKKGSEVAAQVIVEHLFQL
ncbi:SGNH/GDSL hydrolase family protein [Winogradskyella sp. A3E31]|uniref:SGNH/GDSL hydrolase family protein n=1 Tax=Winogradskyella sp. A3E31 TaxID=3349637 RepID=UPI00398AFA92